MTSDAKDDVFGRARVNDIAGGGTTFTIDLAQANP
jgi:hypothetical protein